jgi:hypothetical protein
MRRILLILFVGIFFMRVGEACSQSSHPYQIEMDVITGDGGFGTSTNYDLFGILGQPLGGGLSSSTHYRNYQGMIYALVGTPEQLEAIVLQFPGERASFNGCSLVTNHQPSFLWTSVEPFTKYVLQISTSSESFTAPISKANIQGSQSNWTPSGAIWKKIMTSSYNSGNIQDIYWKVVGTTATKTTEESEVWSFRVGAPQAVTINSPVKSSVLPSGAAPTFDFNTNCNVKFKLEISSSNDFLDSSKIKGANYSVKDPNLDRTLSKTVSSSLWSAVKKLVGSGTGYFRIKAWDGLSRITISEVRPFIIE